MKKAKESLESGAERRREESRQKILDAAMELFYVKGYNETTTRDIIRKAGILNGSLYNRFKGKDEILQSIVLEALNDALNVSAESIEKEKDPLVPVTLLGAMELYAASSSRKVADMLYEAHKNWGAVTELVDTSIAWASKYLARFGIEAMQEEYIRMNLLSGVGAMGNMVGYYSHGGQADYRVFLRSLISMTASALHIPVFDLEGTVKKLTDLMDNGGIVICGRQMRDVRKGVASEPE